MNTKALRQKILDLAIHGKLVPQDPNDEPASVLLERIRAEKERLIKEGKIKKPKKSKAACDKPHYPFELPKGWEWCRLEDYVFSVTDGDHQAPPKVSKGIPFLVISNIADGSLDFSNTRYVPEEYYEKIQMERKPKRGDILFSVTGSYGIVVNIKTDRQFCFQRHIGLIKPTISNEYLSFVLMSNYIKSLCDKLATGTAQKTVGLDTLRSLYVPIAPIEEQERIVAKIKHLFLQISFLEAGNGKLVAAIKQAKSKILELAIHGNLVSQDSNDEPASELLKRINPKAEITCDNPHYQNLPKGWAICSLENIIEYEQPTAYIVSSTDYDVSYLTPVLTAGKSFIIGHTNEKNGIYTNLPCIIFDDFTTDSKLVDFPFKVKSSAMKILQVKEEISIEYVAMFMSITRLISDTHKRYWISEYSKINIPIPPKDEQCRIVETVHVMFAKLDKISENL